MFQQSDITEQYLVKIYDDFQKEQMRLLGEMKNLGENDAPNKDKDIQKQLKEVNAVIMGALKLRNVKEGYTKKGKSLKLKYTCYSIKMVHTKVFLGQRNFHTKSLIRGSGMGSVLLNKGGAGSGSSYSEVLLITKIKQVE
jgi:hypothetical protein